KTQMELSSSESAQQETGRQQAITKVKVIVSNTAPEEPNWPKIVFMGVGLSVARLGDTSTISPHQLRSREVRPDETPELELPPWWQDDKFKRFSEIRYNRILGQDFRIVGQDFPDATSDERAHGEVLFPGQSVIFEMDVPPQEIPYLQFRVDGTVSRRHLFHYQETLVMPETFTKPLALAALRALNAIDIHRAPDSVIASMPDFNSATRLAEIQTFTTTLSTGMTEIKATREAVSNVFSQHKMFWFQAHLRAAFICLNRVSAALARMKEAIASNTPDKIAAESSALQALKGEAAQFNRATEELMHRHNISDEEVNYRYRGQ
ncbi:MAG: hypothetical protein V1849_02230, partial [Chloroflexota bacterium]